MADKNLSTLIGEGKEVTTPAGTEYVPLWGTGGNWYTGSLSSIRSWLTSSMSIPSSVQSVLDLKANDSAVVHLTGSETIIGQKIWNGDNYFRGGLYAQGAGSATLGSNLASLILANSTSGSLWNIRNTSTNELAMEYFNGASWTPKMRLRTGGLDILVGEVNLDNGASDGADLIFRSAGNDSIAIDNVGALRIFNHSQGLELYRFNRGQLQILQDSLNNATIRHSNGTKNWYVGLRGDSSNVWAIADDVGFRLQVSSSGDLIVGTQNWTNDWTTYTPVVSGSAGGSATSYGYQSGAYKQIGKRVDFWFSVSVTNKGTLSGSAYVSLPPVGVNGAQSNKDIPIAGFLCAPGANPITSSRGVPVLGGSQCIFLSGVDTGAVTWATVVNGDVFRVSGTYWTA